MWMNVLDGTCGLSAPRSIIFPLAFTPEASRTPLWHSLQWPRALLFGVGSIGGDRIPGHQNMRRVRRVDMNTDVRILNDIINDKHVCGVPPHRDASVTFEDIASQHDEVVDRPLERRRVGVLRSRAAAVRRVVRVRHARLQRR